MNMQLFFKLATFIFSIGALMAPAEANPLLVLPTLLVQSTCNELKSATMPTSSTLLTYWNFNEAAGSTTASDSSGNGVTGTLSGGGTFGVAGRLNTALTLNGSDGYLNMANPATVRPTVPFSVSTWIKFNALPTVAAAIMGSNATGGTNVYSGFTVFIKSNGQLVSQVGPNASACATNGRKTFYSAIGAITTNKWYFVTVVFNSVTSHTLYLNGLPLTTTTDGNSLTMVYGAANEFRVGFYEKPNPGCLVPSSYINATIDEMALWSGALTATEIKTMYDSQSCGNN